MRIAGIGLMVITFTLLGSCGKSTLVDFSLRGKADLSCIDRMQQEGIVVSMYNPQTGEASTAPISANLFIQGQTDQNQIFFDRALACYTKALNPATATIQRDSDIEQVADCQEFRSRFLELNGNAIQTQSSEQLDNSDGISVMASDMGGGELRYVILLVYGPTGKWSRMGIIAGTISNRRLLDTQTQNIQDLRCVQIK